MRSYISVLGSAIGVILMTAAILPVLGQSLVCVTVFRQRRGRAFRIGAATLLAADVLLMSLLLDAAFTPDYLLPRSCSVFAARAYELPWPWAAALIACALISAAAGLISCQRYAGRRVLPEIIKEAVDLLPVGICIGRADDAVVLANVQMTRWCYALTGHSLSSYQALRNAVWENGAAQGESVLLRLPDRTVLLFGEDTFAVDGAEYRQLTAADVTERYRVTEELEAKNARLRDIRLRMRAYGVEQLSLIMSREILHARATVHDEVNHVLLRIKHYLDHPEAADTEALLKLIRQTNGLLLREAEEPDDARRDGWEDAIALASGIGVKPVITGAVPEGERLRTLLGGALRECAVNAAKHAGADCLLVSIDEGESSVAVEFRSGGGLPAEPVTESGGLRLLRAEVEEAGGTMLVRMDGDFSVKLALPKTPPAARDTTA